MLGLTICVMYSSTAASGQLEYTGSREKVWKMAKSETSGMMNSAIVVFRFACSAKNQKSSLHPAHLTEFGISPPAIGVVPRFLQGFLEWSQALELLGHVPCRLPLSLLDVEI